MRIKKIYHHYEKWEEYKYGMWRKVSKEEESQYLRWAIDFTGDADLYGSWMLRVVNDWPISCEQNLSDSSLNRQAWIGHAACSYANKCPEYIVRMAWWELTQEQRDAANLKADYAIEKWELNFIEGASRGESRIGSQLLLCF